MVWGIPSRLDRLGCSDSDISASSGVEENSWSQSSKIGRAQRRDKRHPASSAKDRVSPWFEELFTHREKPAKKARKSNGNVKPRRCSCHPRSSQEWGLVRVIKVTLPRTSTRNRRPVTGQQLTTCPMRSPSSYLIDIIRHSWGFCLFFT